MIFRRHIPDLPLREHIDWLWYYDHFYPGHGREHVLPDGTFELVIDLRETPRKLFCRQDCDRYDSFRNGWLSGTHARYIVIDALPDSSMMGVHFKPGAAGPLLGLPADALSDRVVEIEAIWGLQALELREQILAAPTPAQKFLVLEAFLLQRWSKANPASSSRKRVAWAVQQFLTHPDLPAIGGVADHLGVSHKHFIDEFRRDVGLTPKVFCRIRRFQRVLAQAQAGAAVDWADVACRCGYFDQSHFAHDFKGFAGLTPSEFIQCRLEDPNFVPVG